MQKKIRYMVKGKERSLIFDPRYYRRQKDEEGKETGYIEIGTPDPKNPHEAIITTIPMTDVIMPIEDYKRSNFTRRYGRNGEKVVNKLANY